MGAETEKELVLCIITVGLLGMHGNACAVEYEKTYAEQEEGRDANSQRQYQLDLEFLPGVGFDCGIS